MRTRVSSASVSLLAIFLCVAASADAPAASHHAVPSEGSAVVGPALLDRYAEELRAHHPALAASAARTEAAELGLAGTRRFADPTFRLGGGLFDERNMSAREEGNLGYGIEQKLPLLGKEQAARSSARAEAEAAATRAEVRFQDLRRSLARALHAAALAEETVRLGREDLAWLDTTVTAAEARYAGGTASQFDLLRVQNERAKRATQLANDERRRDAARALVNHALGRDPLVPLPELALPPVAGELVGSDALVERAVRNAPDLRVLARERRVAEAAVEVARRSRRPDIALGVEGRQFAGDGGFRNGTFTVSLNLPWFNRANYRRDLDRERAKLRAAEADHADAAVSVRNEVHHLVVETEAARREALLYRDDVSPRSGQALAAAHAAWSGGKGMMNDVLEARRMKVEAKLMLARAVAAQQDMLSDLSFICGVADITAPEAAPLSAGPAAMPAKP